MTEEELNLGNDLMSDIKELESIKKQIERGNLCLSLNNYRLKQDKVRVQEDVEILIIKKYEDQIKELKREFEAIGNKPKPKTLD